MNMKKASVSAATLGLRRCCVKLMRRVSEVRKESNNKLDCSKGVFLEWFA